MCWNLSSENSICVTHVVEVDNKCSGFDLRYSAVTWGVYRGIGGEANQRNYCMFMSCVFILDYSSVRLFYRLFVYAVMSIFFFGQLVGICEANGSLHRL